MLVHELLLGNGEGAEFVAEGVFILSNIDKHVRMDCSMEYEYDSFITEISRSENQITQLTLIDSKNSYINHI